MEKETIIPPINNPPICRSDLHQGSFWYDPPTDRKPEGRLICITRRFWGENETPSLELSIMTHNSQTTVEVTQASFLELAQSQKIHLIQNISILKAFSN